VETLLVWLNWETHVSEAKCATVKQKCFLLDSETFPCFQDAKFAYAKYVSRAARLGNISIYNNVSATVFPSLARPLARMHALVE